MPRYLSVLKKSIVLCCMCSIGYAGVRLFEMRRPEVLLGFIVILWELHHVSIDCRIGVVCRVISVSCLPATTIIRSSA